MRNLVIIGAGGHAKSVAEAAFSRGFSVSAFIDQKRSSTTLLGRDVWASLPPGFVESGGCLAVAIGNNLSREQAFASLNLPLSEDIFPPIIHQSASVSHFSRVGPGAVVLQNAAIGADAEVASFVIVNTGATIDHDCSLHSFSSVAPGVSMGGAATLGLRSVIGIGACIRHGIEIGADTVIGAASFVNRDVPALVTAFGIPARVRKSRSVSDPYL